MWCSSDSVDAASSEVVLDAVDLTSPGPLALGRTWVTGGCHDGLLGAGWTPTLDRAVLVDRAQNVAVVRLKDGSVFEVPLPAPSGETRVRAHGLRLAAEVDGYPPLADVAA